MTDFTRSRPKRPLLPLAVLMLALATGAARLFLAAPAEGTQPPAGKQVRITLHLDANGNPDAINVPAPDPVPLSKSQGHWAHWHLDYAGKATLLIQMKGGPAPFAEQPNCNGKECTSGPPVAAVRDDPYPYKVMVTLDGGAQLPVLDPGIKVDP